MDWPCSRAYVDRVEEAFGIPVLHSWREGGFEREMQKLGENRGGFVADN
jgi:hypothetical protein